VGFPWQALAARADSMMLMSYWTDRIGCPAIPRFCSYGYTALNVRITRALSHRNVPVHVIGGQAAATTRPAMRDFIAAVRASGAQGASMYDVNSSPAWQWRMLRAFEGYRWPN
jgi:hypothetical protein